MTLDQSFQGEQNAAAIPEQVFDQYFRSGQRSEEDRQLFCGRDSLWNMPPERQALLREIQIHLNTTWALQRAVPPNGSAFLPIHLDYIDTRHCGAGEIRDRRVINAVAFEERGIAFIGVTRDLVEELFRTSWLIANAQQVRDGFRIFRSADAMTAKFATALFSAQMVFVTSHELGHHVHGHLRLRASRAWHVEFPGPDMLDQADALISQRKEIDADGYAVTTGLNNYILTDGPRTAALTSLARPPRHRQGDKWLARLYVLAAGAFFFARPGVPLSRDGRVDLRRLSHPLGLVRMHYAMHQVRKWAARNDRSGIVQWASQTRFQRLMAALESVFGTEHQDVDWHEQSRFWASAGGSAYRAILDQAEPVVRAQFKDAVWNV